MWHIFRALNQQLLIHYHTIKCGMIVAKRVNKNMTAHSAQKLTYMCSIVNFSPCVRVFSHMLFFLQVRDCRLFIWYIWKACKWYNPSQLYPSLHHAISIPAHFACCQYSQCQPYTARVNYPYSSKLYNKLLFGHAQCKVFQVVKFNSSPPPPEKKEERKKNTAMKRKKRNPLSTQVLFITEFTQ